MYKNIYFLCAECSDGFTHISSMNGCYNVVNRNLNWTTAGLECRRLHRDAHLLIINDAVEQSAVAGILSSTNCQYYFIFVHGSLFFFHTHARRSHLPDGIYASSKVYYRCGPWLNSQNSLRHFAYLTLNFTGVKNFEIWPRFSKPVAFDAL